MFFIFLLLCFFASIILVANHKSRVHRWLSAFIAFAGLGILSIALPECYGILIKAKIVPNTMNMGLIQNQLLAVSNYFMPYTLLVFSLSYFDFPASDRHVSANLYKLALLLPILLMSVIFGVNPILEPGNVNLYYGCYSAWSVPYYCLACAIAVYSCIRETDKRKRLGKLMVNLTILPIVIETLVIGYILPWFAHYIAGQLYLFLVPLQLLAIVAIALKYEFLGIRLKIERNCFEGTIRSMTSGAALMNHSMKNNIGKILICLDNMNSGSTSTEDGNMLKNMNIIRNSAMHLMSLTSKMQECVQDISLNERDGRLTDIIDDSLTSLMPYLDQSHISIVKKYCLDIILNCDSFHLKEVLCNILRNALDAMKPEGTLEIEISERNKGAVVSIRDNGAGIRKDDLPYVMNPFFTTKKQQSNFGLGLSYCYNIMKKHGGDIEISSTFGIGTEATLYFPPGRTVRSERISLKGDYEQCNKSDCS